MLQPQITYQLIYFIICQTHFDTNRYPILEVIDVNAFRYEAYFNRKDIDGWEVRQGMNDLCGMDLVPDPRIIKAALHACRRVNDYALAIRFLEACKEKCGNRVSEIYPYIVQEIKPTLTELGIETPEELGYDKPELALQSIYEV